MIFFSDFSTGGLAGGANPAPPSTISATKWRIKMLTRQGGGGGNFAVGEMELRATASGADQASGGSAVSSGEFSGSYLDDYAFDNNTANWWVSDNGGGINGWVGYDKGSSITVYEVAVTSRTDIADDNALTANIEYWDGSAWQLGWDVIWPTWTTSETKLTRQTATGQRWRVKVTATDGTGAAGFAEVEMRTAVGGADQCSGGVAFASGEYSGSYLDDYAFDDNSGTAWADGVGGGVGNWVAYEFYAQKEIVEIVLTARTDDWLGAGKAFSFERYNVATLTWDAVWTATTSNFTAGETKTFTRPGA